MNKKITGIVSYITIIGWIIAFLAGDKEGAKFHLNQSLVINLASLVNNLILSRIFAIIPIIGGLLSLVVSVAIFIFWILSLIAAIKEENREIPYIGRIKILK